MSRISPKPIIERAIQVWKAAPSMTYALVRDLEGNHWIVESCPVGTQFWTLEQAANLASGKRSRMALREAVALGRKMASLERSHRKIVHQIEGSDEASRMLTSPKVRKSHRVDSRALNTGKMLTKV